MKPCTQPVAAATNKEVETEAVEAVNFLWKRKHFDGRDWKRKQSRKRPILTGAGSGSKKSQR